MVSHHWQPVGAVDREALLARIEELRERMQNAPSYLLDSLAAELRKLLAELQRAG